MKTGGMFILFCLGLSAVSAGREWSDSSGVFKVEAELVEVAGRTVHLRKADGTVVAVPLERLSAADQQYLRTLGAGGGRPGAVRPADRLRAALDQPTRYEFIQCPLDDVVAFFKEQHRIEIQLDRRALDDIGLDRTAPVSGRGSGVTLAKGLDELLAPLKLTWLVWNDVVLVTTPVEAESKLSLRVYRLKQPLEFDRLIEDLTKNIEPATWSEVGGPGAVKAFPPAALVVAQTYRVQRQIQEHYADLLEPVPAAEDALPPTLAGTPVGKSLQGLSRLEFIETPLEDVVAFLQAMHGIRVSLDERALEDIGLSKDAALTLTLKDLPLRSVLSLVVRPLGLAWTADRDGVWITTPEGFQSKLELISYPLDEWKAGGQIDALIAVITATIAPQAWDRVGGPGSVRAGIRGTLDVRQTFPVQLQISGLLADLRAAREAGSR